MGNQRLLEACHERPDDTKFQIAIAIELLAEDPALLSAAEASYQSTCDALARPIDPQFLARFKRSWAEFSVNALSNILAVAPASHFNADALDLGGKPELLLLWHFPEYPLLMPTFIEREVYCIVGDDARWMAPLEQSGLVGNFRGRSGLLRLRHPLKARQSIAVAIDYWHRGTRAVIVPFMGQACATPAGIVDYCTREGYILTLVTPTAGGDVSAVDVSVSPDDDTPSILSRVNELVAHDILANPARWLMWPALSSRTV